MFNVGRSTRPSRLRELARDGGQVLEVHLLICSTFIFQNNSALMELRSNWNNVPGEIEKKFHPSTICRTYGAGWVKMME
ncbi:MAG: hypothetical protein SRB2_01042 [Desulfobacteraceae bacterium Eth-SRB2]|nr:MAG: hypothetical protein SRB2_01042 [Desulfobacteraceae bacterium Eth-SRB2]